MKKLEDYILHYKKPYNYRIKFLDKEITDEVLDKLEGFLSKYEVQDVSKPFKTVFQERPTDFPEAECGEVYMIDVTTDYAASPQMLQSEIARYFRIPEKNVNIRSEYDPRLETDSESEPESDEDYDVMLSTSPTTMDGTVIDHKEFFGDEYNEIMLKTLEKQEAIMSKYDVIGAEGFNIEPKNDTKKDPGPVRAKKASK